jgi:hypothetical protein
VSFAFFNPAANDAAVVLVNTAAAWQAEFAGSLGMHISQLRREACHRLVRLSG